MPVVTMTDPDQDELEPSQLVAGELERLARHPREEAHRLHDVADAGESGSAPFIEIGAVARWLVPFVQLISGSCSASTSRSGSAAGYVEPRRRFASCVRVLTSSLRNTLCRWYSTVPRLMKS